MHRLATSSSTRTRLRFAGAELAGLAHAPEVLVLTPTKGAGDDFVKTYGLSLGRAGLHRYTPLQLALEISVPELARRGRTPVTGVAIEAVIVRAVHRASQQDALRYFSDVSDTVGFTRALGRTLSELRLGRLRQQSLRGIGASGDDLALLLAEYERELEEAKLADPAMVYEAARVVLDDQQGRFTRLPAILIDVLPGSAVEAWFLQGLVAQSPHVAAVALPQAGTGMDRLSAAMRTDPEAIEEAGLDDSLHLLRTHVFEAATPSHREPDPSVVFFSATDEGRECVEIARHIQTAAGNGTRFDRVAILLRNPDAYQPLVEDALRRAGIPGYYTRGSVRPNPSGRAFLALLSCRAEGLSASRFAEYLSLGQVPMLEEDGIPPPAIGEWIAAQGELFPETALPAPDTPVREEPSGVTDSTPISGGTLRTPFAWETLIVDASVIGSRNRWETRLEGLEEELDRRIGRLRPEEDARREYVERQLADLGRLKRYVLPIIALLDSLPAAASWGSWLDQLETLAERTLRQPAHVLSVLAELRPMGEVGPVAFEEVVRVLTNRLSFLRNEAPDRPYGKVFVATIREASARSFEIVFVPGVSEGVFPRKTLEDPLLLDEHRGQLEGSLPLREDRVREERLLLHLAVGAAGNQVLISYPRMDIGQGRARVPSFYALDILRAAEGRIPDLNELEHRAIEASMSRLGWPSPNRPVDAVDDAEYDLAAIGTLMRQPRSQVQGRGRYLLDTNTMLARSLRSRARRWRNFWSDADGIVDPDAETLQALAGHRLKTRSYSPTALQHFAACPYRFLLYAVLRLHPREKVENLEQLDPLTRGSLFHDVQFRLLSELRRQDLLPVQTGNLEQVRRVLDATLNGIADEYREELAPAISRVWESEIEDIRTDLAGWLRQEAQSEKDDPGWLPTYFEFSFGLDDSRQHDPSSRREEATVLDGIRLRGAIDMIERHSGSGLLRTVDHKTGRPPARFSGSVGGGEVLQPTLYALAAEALLGEPVAVSSLYFCTQRGDFRKVEVAVNDESRSHVQAALQLVDESIETGFLPAAPRAGACMYCDYRMVCGPYEELRTGRKERKRLESIERIRQLP